MLSISDITFLLHLQDYNEHIVLQFDTSQKRSLDFFFVTPYGYTSFLLIPAWYAQHFIVEICHNLFYLDAISGHLVCNGWFICLSLSPYASVSVR